MLQRKANCTHVYNSHMKAINTIIFSMNRAAQLDLLLQSIKRYAPWMWPPTILYRTTSDPFALGYSILMGEHGIDLTWQLPLKEMLLATIDPDVPLTTMLVDDSVFFAPFGRIISLPHGVAFAPHLGKNCTYCYPFSRPQKEGESDFLTAWTVDGNIYRTYNLLDCLRAVEFTTPNNLEDSMGRAARPMRVIYAERSCMVTIPANVVQHEYPNRHGGGSAEELNARYLAGERLDLDAMDFSNVTAWHQEIPYIWRQAR